MSNAEHGPVRAPLPPLPHMGGTVEAIRGHMRDSDPDNIASWALLIERMANEIKIRASPPKGHKDFIRNSVARLAAAALNCLEQLEREGEPNEGASMNKKIDKTASTLASQALQKLVMKLPSVEKWTKEEAVQARQLFEEYQKAIALEEGG